MNNFEETIIKIVENYENLEKSIVNQLKLSVPAHNSTTGTYREEVWRSLFEQIIPKKFVIEQGVFIIDSYGSISKEVDLVIYDESYTPYIFNYGAIKFIPIEAVTAVIQCKSTNVSAKGTSKKIRIVEEWVNYIDDLKTSTNSVARMVSGLIYNGIDSEGKFDKLEKENKYEELKKEKKYEEIRLTELENNPDKKQGVHNLKKSQTATRPIKILCYTTGSFNNKYLKNKKNVNDEMFDFIIKIDENNDNNNNLLIKGIDNENLSGYNKKLNHSKITLGELYAKEDEKKCERKLSELTIKKEGEILTIMSLIFQLNQLLMIINNPMLFPHKAYVEMFNRIINENKAGKNGEKK